MAQTTYTIRELQNCQSYRVEEGKYTCKSLSGAKKLATRMQFYQDTVMIIENEVGERLAIKENGKWITF